MGTQGPILHFGLCLNEDLFGLKEHTPYIASLSLGNCKGIQEYLPGSSAVSVSCPHERLEPRTAS